MKDKWGLLGAEMINIDFEELTHSNVDLVKNIDRDDISEEFLDTVDTIMDITDYGVRHQCIGHTLAVKTGNSYIGLILIGEALPWDTDPAEMRQEPFYRLMGFVIDKHYRGAGIGGTVLEEAINLVYRDFGIRPIALGCHKDNHDAERFYLKHGFRKTDAMEGNDYYYLRYPENV